MLNYVQKHNWRERFASLEQALGGVEERPEHFDAAAERWAAREPTLLGLRAQYLFAAPGRLTEPQARALIRTARAGDPDADLAAWALIYQFVNPIIAAAEIAEWHYGQAREESVDTAIADLYASIHRISLETNHASIFFALSKMMRKAVLRPRAMPLDRRVYDHYEEWQWDYLPGQYQSTDDSDVAEIDWECTIDSLTDFLADDLVDALGWNRENRYYARRHARLRAFVACRVSEAATGGHSSAAAIAAEIGESVDVIKALQADVNKVWCQQRPSQRETLADLLGQAA